MGKSIAVGIFTEYLTFLPIFLGYYIGPEKDWFYGERNQADWNWIV